MSAFLLSTQVPVSDKKFYRLIRLENGIRCLLVHERESALPAAASGDASDAATVSDVTVIRDGLRALASEPREARSATGGADSEATGSAPEKRQRKGSSASQDRHSAVSDGSQSQSAECDGVSRSSPVGEFPSASDEDARVINTSHAGVHPSSAQKAAVALTVGGGAGSLADPGSRQGMAHFCEHMLFMGSARYPGENEYDSFLASNGGSSNAFTENEGTCYQCDVNPGALIGAMDRMSSFFEEPLFNASSVAREAQAVESEFSQNRSSDSSRLAQMQAHTFAGAHPYHGFGWGNLKSLLGPEYKRKDDDNADGDDTTAAAASAGATPASHGPIIEGIVADLKSFYSQAYDTRRMHLVVRGDGCALDTYVAPSDTAGSGTSSGTVTPAVEAALDALEAGVRSTFGRIPPTTASSSSASIAAVASASDRLPNATPAIDSCSSLDAVATMALLRNHYGVDDRSLERGDRWYPRDKSHADTGKAAAGTPIASSGAGGTTSGAFCGGHIGARRLESPLVVDRYNAEDAQIAGTSFAPRVHFIRPTSNKHTLLLTWALPPMLDWSGKRPEMMLGHIVGHEADGTVLHYLRQAGWAVSITAGVGDGGYDTTSICSLFTVKVGCTALGIANWRSVVTVLHAYIVHVLCGGVNVAESCFSLPPVGSDGLPSAVAAAGASAGPASGSRAGNAAADPFAAADLGVTGTGAGAAPTENSATPSTFSTISGYAVPASTLSLLHAVCASYDWMQAETAQAARLEYHYGDEEEPLDACVSASLSMALHHPKDEDIIIGCSDVLGEASLQDNTASDETPLLKSCRRDGFAPAVIAYLAAHLTPGNMRVDIMTPFVGPSRAHSGDEDDGGHTDNRSDEEDEDDDDDVVSLADPDPLLQLPVSLEDGDGDADQDENDDEGGDDDGEMEDGEDGQQDGDDGDSGDGTDDDADEAAPDMDPPSFMTDYERSRSQRCLEPWFCTPYVSTTVDPATVAAWVRPPAPAVLSTSLPHHPAAASDASQGRATALPLMALPPRNPYMPTDLNIKAAQTSASSSAAPITTDKRPGTERVPSEIARVSYAPAAAASAPPQAAQLVLVTEPASTQQGPLIIARLWHKQDDVYHTPRTSIYAHVHLPCLYADPLAAVGADVWWSLTREDLTQDSYLASCAGLSSYAKGTRHGVEITVSGFSHRAGTLLAKTVQALTLSQPTGIATSSAASAGYQLDEARFSRWRDHTSRVYQNEILYVGTQARMERNRVVHVWQGDAEVSWNNKVEIIQAKPLSAAVSKPPKGKNAKQQQASSKAVAATRQRELSREWLLHFVGGAAASASAPSFDPLDSIWTCSASQPIIVDLLVHGNEDEASAKCHLDAIVAPIVDAVNRWMRTLSSSQLKGADSGTWSPIPAQMRASSPVTASLAALYPPRASLLIPSGTTVARSVPSVSGDEVNGYTLVQYQAGSDCTPLRVRVDLIDDLLSEPLFDQLRTNQQLGYEVSCERTLEEGTGLLGMAFVIKSATHDPADVRQRLEHFISSHRQEIVKLCTCRDASNSKPCPLDARIQSLIQRKLRSDGALSEESWRHWVEIKRGRCLFGRIADEVAELSAMLSSPTSSSTGARTHAAAADVQATYERLLLSQQRPTPAAMPTASASGATAASPLSSSLGISGGQLVVQVVGKAAKFTAPPMEASPAAGKGPDSKAKKSKSGKGKSASGAAAEQDVCSEIRLVGPPSAVDAWHLEMQVDGKFSLAAAAPAAESAHSSTSSSKAARSNPGQSKKGSQPAGQWGVIGLAAGTHVYNRGEV